MQRRAICSVEQIVVVDSYIPAAGYSGTTRIISILPFIYIERELGWWHRSESLLYRFNHTRSSHISYDAIFTRARLPTSRLRWLASSHRDDIDCCGCLFILERGVLSKVYLIWTWGSFGEIYAGGKKFPPMNRRSFCCRGAHHVGVLLSKRLPLDVKMLWAASVFWWRSLLLAE